MKAEANSLWHPPLPMEKYANTRTASNQHDFRRPKSPMVLISPVDLLHLWTWSSALLRDDIRVVLQGTSCFAKRSSYLAFLMLIHQRRASLEYSCGGS